MIKLPDRVHRSLFSLQRSISAKVYLEIGKEMVDITETLVSFSIDESVSQGSLPYGQITYNQLSITVDNLDKRYMLNNSQSPYYGKLISLKRIRIEYQIEYEEEKYYTIALGDYYVDSWKATTDSSTATVTAFDILYKYGSNPLRKSKIYKQISVTKAFQLLFEENGITTKEYAISPGLSTILDFWWSEGETLADSLQALAEIAGANVFCDKNGMIRVKPIWDSTPKVMDLKDEDVIINTKAEPNYKEAYSIVDIKYKAYNELKIEEIYKSDSNIEISAGSTVTKEFKCSSNNILDILAVTVSNTSYITVLSFECINDICRVKLFNTLNKLASFSISIIGRRIDAVDKEYISDNECDANNTLSMDTNYILHEREVTRLAAQLKNLYRGNITSITLDIRALPHLELYDRVMLNSDYVGIYDEFYVTALSYDFSEGLMGTVTLSASIKAVPQKRIFISPGLSILVKEESK